MPSPHDAWYFTIYSCCKAIALYYDFFFSFLQVCDKPAPARGESLLNIRHLSYHRQRWLPLRKYKPKSDVPKVRSIRQIEISSI